MTIDFRKGFQVKVIADSISCYGPRLTTLQLRYPRFIHGEVLTHRDKSRNSASSRAIPVAKMIEQVRNDPAGPVWWGKNQPGMQAREELTGSDREQAEVEWLYARDCAAYMAEALAKRLVHKQIVNRLLEPWQWMETIMTATEWINFFDLRCHPDAQPEFQFLARMMRDAMESSVPNELHPGDWHLPYVEWSWTSHIPSISRGQQAFLQRVDQCSFPITLHEAAKASTARCARVSYMTHDGASPDLGKDIKLHDDLVVAKPMHASPAEHQATPDELGMGGRWAQHTLHGNLKGWVQYRKVLERPHRIDYFIRDAA